MTNFATLVLVVLPVLTLGDPDIVSQYKCGSDCDEKLMGSDDPTADSMPHTFGSNIPLSPTGLTNTMNAYLKDDPVHQEDALMVPRPHAVMPDVQIVASSSANCAEPVTALIPTAPSTVPIDQRIPYDQPNESPPLRRPCNLDEVMELLKAVKQSMLTESDRDAQLHAALESPTSPLAISQANLQTAQQQLADLGKAKDADDSLQIVIENIRMKSDALLALMSDKAELIKNEGTLKQPIVKSIGRTNVNLQAIISAKQAALNDFAQNPAVSKDEVTKLLATYDELIMSHKHQLQKLNKEANDILTPIQLKINQTDHAIEQAQAEIGQLTAEAEELKRAAETYTPAALHAAQLAFDDVLNTYNAEKGSRDIDLRSFDQRSKDRDDIVHLVDEMLTLIVDIQEPQDPDDVYVEVRQPVSLLGSVPRRAKN